MKASTLALFAGPAAAETVLGVYIFHRHGDRTPKALAPANLTDLGYQEVYQAGEYFRSRYVASGATSRISGINSDVVKLSQLSISASADNVLMNSAQGFSQALYPAVGDQAATDNLRNGSSVSAPMNGYQLIPVATVSNGQGAENSAWLQDSSNCGNAKASSNEYFSTPEYQSVYNASQSFYKSLYPVVNATFPNAYMTYENAYSIFDLINVATIHNRTIPSQDLLTPDTLSRLQSLAAIHEYNLAYNASSQIRGIAGMQLAAEALQYLNTTVAKAAGPKLGIQFGAYGTMQSYFGLAGLTPVPGAPGTNTTFTGIPDYASALVWELFTPGDRAPTYPVNANDLMVRFLFHNGTSSNSSAPVAYPLFGSNNSTMPWNDFVAGTNKFAIGNGQQWCSACGNSTGACAQYADATSSGAGSSSSAAGASSSGGLSSAVAGVIGAMVTLAVILLAELAVIFIFGLRLVSKRRLAAAGAGGSGAAEKVASGSSSQ